MSREVTVKLRVDTSRFDAAAERLGAAADKLQAEGRLGAAADKLQAEGHRLATIELDTVNHLLTMFPSPFLTATLKALEEAEEEERRRRMVDAGELEE